MAGGQRHLTRFHYQGSGRHGERSGDRYWASRSVLQRSGEYIVFWHAIFIFLSIRTVAVSGVKTMATPDRYCAACNGKGGRSPSPEKLELLLPVKETGAERLARSSPDGESGVAW